MATNKRRFIYTRIWNDSFVADLDPSEKLLFIYFLTNEHSNLAGIYEIPIKIIALETGIDGTMVRNVLKRLKDKVRYLNGYIIIRNHLKHQDIEVPNILTNVVNDLKALDKKWLSGIVEKKLYHISKDLAERISISYPNDSRYSNLNLNSNSKPIAPEPEAPTPYDLKEEIDKLENDKKRHIQIIGLYFKQKKPDIRSKEQMNVAIKRHAKAAASLVPFTDDQILKGFRKASDVGGWTIETVVKILTK